MADRAKPLKKPAAAMPVSSKAHPAPATAPGSGPRSRSPRSLSGPESPADLRAFQQTLYDRAVARSARVQRMMNGEDPLRSALLEKMGAIQGETTHSGEVPELTEERRELYKAVGEGNLEAVKTALLKTRISCREGAYILLLLTSDQRGKVQVLVEHLLTEGSGATGMYAPLEVALLDQIGDQERYKGAPKVGAMIHILGTTHAVLYVGEGEVVSLNNEETFQTRKLTDEIQGLLASSAETVQTMLKRWREGYPNANDVLGEDAGTFDDYVYEEDASQGENEKYIEKLKLRTPEGSCSVSEALANHLF